MALYKGGEGGREVGGDGVGDEGGDGVGDEGGETECCDDRNQREWGFACERE